MAMLNLCEQSLVIAKNVCLASLLGDEKSLLVVSFNAFSFITLGLGHNINCRVQTGGSESDSAITCKSFSWLNSSMLSVS